MVLRRPLFRGDGSINNTSKPRDSNVTATSNPSSGTSRVEGGHTAVVQVVVVALGQAVHPNQKVATLLEVTHRAQVVGVQALAEAVKRQRHMWVGSVADVMLLYPEKENSKTVYTVT